MNNYQVISQIGEGAFGKVFLVREMGGDRQSVIKQIDLRMLSMKEKEASKTEVLLLSKMNHPNIVSFITSFKEGSTLFIVMEFCDGGDLMRRISMQRGLPFSEEQNIFLTSGGMTAKLGDFGIARMLKNTMEMARTFVGTPYYLSPEICENQPYNNKTDIWSLGCVLYELCTLRHPFEGSSLRQLVSKICGGRFNPVPGCYSYDLCLLVTQLIKVNPCDRPSVSCILKRPFLEKLIQKHLDPEVIQQEFSNATPQCNKMTAGGAAKKIQTPKRAERHGAAVKHQNLNPKWRIGNPAHHRPLCHRAGRAVADREVGGQHNHRFNFLQHLRQSAALNNHQKDGLPSPTDLQVNEKADEETAMPVEPYQLVAAARQEYLERRHEANQYKLRAEKQLGLRPSTAEVRSRPAGRQEKQREGHVKQRKCEGQQQEYLRQLDVIRQQYHREMRNIRVKAAEKMDTSNHETFTVKKPDVLEREETEDQCEAAAAQLHDIDAALRRITEDPTLQAKHNDKKGIMFEVCLDGVSAKEGHVKTTGGTEKDKHDSNPLNKTMSLRRGTDLKVRDWMKERRRWSHRTQSLLNELANIEAKSVCSTVVEDDEGRRQWSDATPNTLLSALAQAELIWSTMQETAEKEEDDSDVEIDEYRQEPGSDNDDTYFEDSEDELQEAVADSMKNLLIMEDVMENTEVCDGTDSEERERAASTVDIRQIQQPQVKDPSWQVPSEPGEYVVGGSGNVDNVDDFSKT
ncbi:serine/threonine-protein kinase Nek5 isoform X2 [Cynoglossus semilaevis]|uniref:serine/threonine-protein kinase Nek5 isoform X2 n=1 Tax=Cynoglossus semilaevis TaxID=244447 RepID=UPI000D62B169|nr:serine/threonine-protein kinase Nek5 isoform X2 [Cynoglossus semilaevis]